MGEGAVGQNPSGDHLCLKEEGARKARFNSLRLALSRSQMKRPPMGWRDGDSRAVRGFVRTHIGYDTGHHRDRTRQILHLDYYGALRTRYRDY